jgi:hypothetical protein
MSMQPTARTIRRAAMALAVALVACAACAGAALASYDPSDPAQKAQYDAAFALAARGYEYGVPVLNMERTFATSTSVNVPNGRGGGPVNAFSNFTRLADAKDRTVVAPNSDTLYSMAWLNLSRGPQVIHTARGIARFHVLELLSPWEENFANIGAPDGALRDGDYLVTGPGFRGRVPRGLRLLRSPYDRVWIIGRTLIRGKADLPATRKVMRTYRITPLARWNPARPYAYTPPRPSTVDTTIDQAHIPGTAPGEDPATFFDALGDALRRFPPPAADRPILGELRALGIGPGLHPASAGTLTDAQLQAMRDAVTQGPGTVQAKFVARYLAGFDRYNGWAISALGSYGTDYQLRAMIDKVGLGAPRPQVAMYPLALLDHDRGALTGVKRYVAHFPRADARPPVRFFWSMTLYDSDGFFVDNPIGRYLVNDRSGLHYNPDGSLDVYLQPDAPSDPVQRRNWLPTPQPGAATTGFRLIVRLYGLSTAGIRGVTSGRGWRGPTILACGPQNATAQGVACAR